MTNDTVTVRPIDASDVAVVAALHVASWRSAYRGLMADEYLDARAPADRLAHWAQRLEHPGADTAGVIAERRGEPVGFAFLFGNADPHFGTLLDNLHVRPELRGAGMGPRLLAHAAGVIAARGWARGLHLWVFEANLGARRFYERHGAVAAECLPLTTADGSTNPTVRYVWADATTLL